MSSSGAEKSSPKVTEHAGRTKKVVVKVSSSRTVCRTPTSSNSFSSSDEEATPLTHKRKRFSPEKKTSTISGADSKKLKTSRATPSAPESVEQSRPARPAPSLLEDIVQSKLALSPDQQPFTH